MKDYMTGYWNWYNRLAEPWRLFMCVVMVAPMLLCYWFPWPWSLYLLGITGFFASSKVLHDEEPATGWSAGVWLALLYICVLLAFPALLLIFLFCR